MAKDKTQSTANNEQAINAGAALLDELLKKGGAELSLDRHIYQADKCKEFALVGYVIDLLDMPKIKMGRDEERDWTAFCFLTTHPTKGVDREDNIVDVKAETEIIIPATFQLHTALRRFAADPSAMHEVGLQPTNKIDLGGGKTLWQYRVVVTKKTMSRGALYPSSFAAKNSANRVVGGPTLSQLPDGSIFNAATGEIVKSAVAAQG